MAFEGYGYGKVILFGEHFVVYGLPAIASALESKTIARIEKSGKLEIVDDRPAARGYKAKKKEEMARQFDALFRHFKVNTGKLKIRLSGDLFCDSGIGASAALATSVSRALNKMLDLEMDDEQINQAAYIAEEAGSGTPSGIDNTCSVFGGFMTFRKNLSGGPNKIERLSMGKPVEIVMASTGIAQETKVVVDDVRRRKDANPAWFDGVAKQYRDIHEKAVVAIKKADWETVGGLMDENQSLLREIGVSCSELDSLIATAKDEGALGAKLTGTGRGGYVVALTPGKKLQEKVAKAIESNGFVAIRTTIG